MNKGSLVHRESLVVANDSALSFVLADTRYPILTLGTSGTTTLTGLQNQQLLLNTSSGSETLIGLTSGSPVIVRSKMSVGTSSSANVTADLTLVNGGYIGTNTTAGQSSVSLGISGGMTLSSSNASHIILNGNTGSGVLGMYAGNVGTGGLKMYTGADTLRLEINNNGNSLFTPDGVTTVLNVSSLSATFNKPVVVTDTTQSTGVGTGGSLTVSGGASISKNLYVGGNVTSSSDLRLKQGVRVIEEDILDKVLESIRPVKFKYKTDSSTDLPQYGFIAQDFEKYFPELVQCARGGMRSLDYQKVTVLLLKCIFELKRDLLKMKIDSSTYTVL